MIAPERTPYFSDDRGDLHPALPADAGVLLGRLGGVRRAARETAAELFEQHVEVVDEQRVGQIRHHREALNLGLERLEDAVTKTVEVRA